MLTTSSRLLAALAIAAAPVAVFLLAASSSAQESKEPELILCRHADLDGGASKPIDLTAVRRAYDKLKNDVAKALKSQREAAAAKLDLEHDAGLPRCRSRARRLVAPKETLPAELRGRVFWLVAVPDGGATVAREDVIARDERAELFAMFAKRPADAAAVAKRLKRTVTCGTKELAVALGAVCVPSRVRVADDGRTLEIEEGE